MPSWEVSTSPMLLKNRDGEANHRAVDVVRVSLLLLVAMISHQMGTKKYTAKMIMNRVDRPTENGFSRVARGRCEAGVRACGGWAGVGAGVGRVAVIRTPASG